METEKVAARMPRLKRFLSEMGDVVPRSFFHYDDTEHTQESRTELLSIIDECPLSTPKPSRLIQRILQFSTDKNSIILDSFAGSGTTGHAVLKQNAEDGGTRKFILVEMEGEDREREHGGAGGGRLHKPGEGFGLRQPAAAFGHAACCEPDGIGMWRRVPLQSSAVDSPAFAEATAGRQAVSRKAAAGCRSPGRRGPRQRRPSPRTPSKRKLEDGRILALEYRARIAGAMRGTTGISVRFGRN